LTLPCATRSLTIAAKPASLRAVTEFVRQGAREANLPEERIGQLDLLADELITNVCTYAYPDGKPGEVTVTYSVPAPGELRVEMADRGVEFNPLKAGTPDLTLKLEERPIGGLGLHLVKTLASSLTYRREQGWNRLTFGISASS
jgi:serine/threonine-protein kinase RsbW